MVLSGSFQEPIQSKDEYYILGNWTGVQNIEEGYTEITFNVYLQDPWVARCEWQINITLEDVFESFKTIVTDKPQLVKTIKKRFQHNSNGKRTVAMAVSILPSTTTKIRNGSATFELDIISGLEMECSLSSIFHHGFQISAQSSKEADQWAFSLDGGISWTSIPDYNGLSTKVLLSHLKDGTPFSVQVQGRNIYNNIFGYSKVITVKTLQFVRSCNRLYPYFFGPGLYVKFIFLLISQ